MIALAMVVLDVLRHRVPEVPLSERNQPIQTLFFDRTHEAFA
ncbi:MAG: hypothetical protein ABJA98_27160 [Acidobacteriota bacterium]